MQHAHHSIDSIILDIKLRCHYTDSLYGHMYLWGNVILLKQKPTTTLIDLIEYIKATFPSLQLQVDYINRNQVNPSGNNLRIKKIFPQGGRVHGHGVNLFSGFSGGEGEVGSKANFPENNHVNLIN